MCERAVAREMRVAGDQRAGGAGGVRSGGRHDAGRSTGCGAV